MSLKPHINHELLPKVDGVEGETLRKVLKILLANGLIGDMEDNLPDHEKKVESQKRNFDLTKVMTQYAIGIPLSCG